MLWEVREVFFFRIKIMFELKAWVIVQLGEKTMVRGGSVNGREEI